MLWIDEIEKGHGQHGQLRQDRRHHCAVGTLLTNRIDMLPPELLRKGRFDEIFFVDLPNRAIRVEILTIHIRKKKRPPSTSTWLS